ncbi:MAG: hypothetical protein P9L91_07060, partial [Candidatus Zophobacter franzmannii]|nr:hypothetical protein [Candidatus Zophobacter franzmannii]
STGMINWFKQQNVRARDVYDPDTLTDEEENDEINVMAIKIIPEEDATRSWGGIMKYIGNELDFSEMKYIQVLLKPENYERSSPINVTMHIDLGDINENFYTFNEIDGVPELNTEDGANDGTSDGDLEVREDVGLDGIPDGALDDDPNDYFSSIEDHFEFPFINGTEENGVLDTEDLDGNGQLNTLDRYFEYTVDDITNDTDLEYLENDNQGWKLFRIPMTEFNSIVAQTVDPDLSKVKYARIWFEVDETTKINLVEFEVIGNKYSERPIYEVTKPYGDDIEVYYPVDPQTLIVDEESILLGISDNQKDSHYTSPKGTYEVVKGTQTLEQSLRIDVNNLQPNHLGLVRYKESQSSNWLSYGKLRFWVYPEQSQENAYNDPIDIVLRAGADSLNYYEIRYKMLPIPYKTKMESSDWKEIEVDFSKLTELKKYSLDSPDTLFVTDGQFTYVRYKNPTFSAMQELSMGLMIPEHQDGFNGTIYFDDIRVADPFNEMGYAYSVDLRTKFADFIDFSIGYEQKTEDFRKEILRNTAPSYVNRTSFDMTGKINLHKFTPYSWGYNIPLNFSRNQSWGIPRYKANSDILRIKLTDIDLDKEENNSKQYSAEISFSKNASKPHWWTKYTLDATTISARVTYNESTTPTTVDTTMSYNGTYTYNLSIPREKIGLKLFKNYYWYFIPRSYDNSFTLTADDPKRFNWDTNQKEFLPALNTRDTKTVTTNNSINYDIFSDLSSSYRLTTKRDLVLKKYYKDVNIGNETEYKQTIDVNYDPNFFPNVFSLSVSPQTVFNETKRLLNGNAVFNGEEYDFQRTGSVSRVTNVDFTFKNSDMFTSLSRKWKSKPKKSDNSGKAEDGKKEDLPNKTINTDEKNSSSMPKEEGEKSRSETKNELQESVDAGKLTKDEMYDKLANVKEEETKKT